MDVEFRIDEVNVPEGYTATYERTEEGELVTFHITNTLRPGLPPEDPAEPEEPENPTEPEEPESPAEPEEPETPAEPEEPEPLAATGASIWGPVAGALALLAAGGALVVRRRRGA